MVIILAGSRKHSDAKSTFAAYGCTAQEVRGDFLDERHHLRERTREKEGSAET